jgi:hypothetical protein
MVVQENAETLKRKLDTSGFPAVVRKGTAFVSRQVVTVGTRVASKKQRSSLGG